MEDAPKLLKIPKSECPDIWIRLPRHTWPTPWSNIGDPVVPLERNLYGHPLAGLLWERQFKDVSLGLGCEKIPELGMCVRSSETRIVLTRFSWMISKCLEERRIWLPYGRNWWKRWSWRTNFISWPRIFWGVLNVNANRTKPSLKTTENVPINIFCWGNWPVAWSYDMEGHAKKCVERYCKLANKTTQQHYKVSTPCIDDHHFKEEEMKSVVEMSHVCPQVVLKCLYLARIGRPDILWSVNKLARSITKWTKACDKRLNRLISYIHHTHVSIQNLVMWETLPNNAGWDFFKTPILQEILRTQKATTRWKIVRFWKSYNCPDKLDV